MKNTILLALTILLTGQVYSQGLDWTSYSTAQAINSITPDGEYLWLGTGLSGVTRYHMSTGDSEVYNTLNVDLPSNRVSTITVNKDKDVWVGTTSGGGVSRLNTSNSWTHYTKSSLNLPFTNCYSLASDQESNIWGIGGIEVFIYDGITWNNFEDTYPELPATPTTIHIDALNNKWIGTLDGLVKIDNNNIYTLYDTNNWNPLSANVISIASDTNGTIAVGGAYNTLSVLKDNVWSFYSSDSTEMPDGSVHCISFDNQGNTWLGVNRSIVRFDGNTWDVFDKNNSDLSGAIIKALHVDESGIVWIGTATDGFFKFEGTVVTKLFSSNSELPENYLEGIAIDQENNKWITTNSSGLVKFAADSTWHTFDFDNSDIPSVWLKDIQSAPDGTIWFGTQGSGIISFNGSTWTKHEDLDPNAPNGSIEAVEIDQGGIVWAGTDNGLFKYNGLSWQKYNTTNSGIAEDDVASIHAEENGRVYVGGYYGTLSIKDGNQWATYDNSNSPLKSFYPVSDIFVDDSNTIWISSWKIYSFNGIDTWKEFNTGGGFLEEDQQGILWSGSTYFLNSTWTSVPEITKYFNQISTNSLAIDQDGDRWLATTYGLFVGSGLLQTTAIEETHELDLSLGISVYPTVTTTLLNIQLEDPSGWNSIEIIDTYGRILLQQKTVGAANQIPCHTLPHGIYFIRINGHPSTVLRKFMKT